MLAMLLFVMVVGRRIVIYTAMEALLALGLTGYRLKGSFFKKTLILLMLAGFVAVGVTVFMLIRLAGFENPNDPSTLSLAHRAETAMSWVKDGSALSRATVANQSNAEKRTFVLGFFADVLEGSSRRTPGLGRDLAEYVGSVVPRAINPNKDLSFNEEAFADELFGLTYGDSANSILTNGAVDFGLLGVIAYPLLIVVIMRVSIEAFSRLLPPLPMAIIILGAIFTVLQTETATSAYFVSIRNEIIFAIVLFTYTRLPRFGFRRN